MFRKSRWKIVASLMSVLIVLWVGMLTVIYAFSYYDMLKHNRKMLAEHAALYSLEHPPEDVAPAKPAPHMGTPHVSELPEFKLATFYSVAISYDGKILETHNNKTTIYTDGELQSMALEILDKGGTSGVKNSLAYYMADKGGYLLVAFMDNTIINGNMLTLFRYTLIFGGAAILVLFFLAVYLAKRIVNPLEDSYQKQKQFVSDAGHELKTPISVVSANAELLSREIGDNQWLSNIQYENERMGVLVEQLLELARTEDVMPKMEDIDLSRLVIGEALPFESVAFEKGLTLKVDVENGLRVKGCSPQLKQLVSILLDNGIRHSFGGKAVCLTLSKEQKYARLSVINQGKEIPPKQKELLFERFYRLDSVRNSEDKHYGLGLAIAKAIVTAHSGEINIHCYDGFVEFQVLLPHV